METEASIDDLIKKITVLDAIVWMKAAISDIKRETVSNCFKKCGFPITQGEEIEVEKTEIQTELQNLINGTWGIHFLAEDYVAIDADLETESSAVDFAEMISNAEQLEEEEEEEKIEEDESKIITSSEISDYIDKIKKYFIKNKDTTAFEATANLQMYIENLESKKKKNTKKHYRLFYVVICVHMYSYETTKNI